VGHRPGIIAQRSAPLAPGDTLAGYRIERELGRGGMGVVLLAEHLHLGRRAALKVIAPDLADAPGFRERFVEEARSAAALHHPHVVAVYDAGEVDGLLYLAMQHVDGRDLDAVLREQGALPPARVLRLAEQLAGALDAAHAAGLVHRDVKPANVLLAGGDAYLTDFGLTKRSTEAPTGRLTGTALYAAPEQARGRRVDARTDVYAFGAVLFHALTGRPPFVRDDDVATLYAHVHEPVPSVAPALPPALDAVLARALAKRPEDRWGSAGALAAALRVVLDAAGLADAPAVRAVPSGGDPPWVPTLVDAEPVAGAAVLVASADPDVRALVRAALSGTAVAEAADAAAASSAAPAVAVVDWDLEGAPGAARALRAAGAHVLAVIDPDRTSRAEARAEGADDVVTAPFSPVQLQVRLRRLLGADALA
jgi:CheY-like chemotaxis protein